MSIPPSADWAVRACKLYEAQRISEALYAVDTALAQSEKTANDPRHAAAAHSLRGATRSHLGRLEEAAREQEIALALDAANAGIWRHDGLVQSAYKQYAEAPASFKKALDRHAHEPLIWVSKAAALIALDRRDEAVQAYDHALALAPNNAAELWTYNSEQLVELHRYDDALAAANTAVEVATRGGDASRAWYAKGLALVGLKQYEQAAEAYEQALSKDPNSLTYWERKSEALLHSHHFRDAWAALWKAAQLRTLLRRPQRYERRLP
jgi:tetratricopeptide (TPR) repeat protein